MIGKFIIDSIDLLNEMPYIVFGRNVDGVKVSFYDYATINGQLQPNQYSMECIIFDLGDYISENKETKTLVNG